MKYFLLFFLTILMVSCSPQKKLAKLLDKNPELTRSDTIRVVEDFLIEVDVFELDTFVTAEKVVKGEFEYDTNGSDFEIQDENVKTTVTIRNKNLPYPIIDIKTVVSPDTIYRRDTIQIKEVVEVEVDKVITTYKVKKRGWFISLLAILGCFFLLGMIVTLLYFRGIIIDFFKKL